MPLNISRRSVLAGATALSFLRGPGARAATSATLTFGLSSYPPSIQPWTNTGTAAATVKLMIHRGLTGFAPDGSLRGELADTRIGLEAEKRLRLEVTTELAAERRRLLDALAALDIERRELQETRAVLESARARLQTLRRLSARFPRLSAAVKKIIRYDDANHQSS